MEKKQEHESRLPFKVSIDKEFDWDSLTFRVEFPKVVSEEERKRFKKTVEEWAEEGVDEGYGEGVMHHLDDEFDWSRKGIQVEFFADMGSSAETALDELFGRLSAANIPIKEVKIGSGYYW